MPETKSCQNCKQPFIITPEDGVFYTKLNVPSPTWCPDCRNMRRLAWRNERTLYLRDCDLCKKQTLSIYHPSVAHTVYCRPCWRSDGWNAMQYGRSFDFTRLFFDQFKELFASVPRCALMSVTAENSEYCNEVDGVKDSYMAICTFYGERLFYTYWTAWSNDCFDCSYILKNNLCYDCQDVHESYQCRSVFGGTNMVDSAFCINSSDCMNCFMCVNLHHKSYFIRNKQYTKEAYFVELAKYNLASWDEQEKLKQELWDWSKQFPRRFAAMRGCENCTGDYVWTSKDVHHGFDVLSIDGGRYIYDSGGAKDSMDCSQAGIESELMYELHSSGHVYNTHFGNWVGPAVDCEYIDSCEGVQKLFGCVGLKQKKYCILNVQYSEEEYNELRIKIIEYMKKSGEYGAFFPVALSPYAYNETVAHQWYPHTKEQVLQKGWKWRDDLPGTFGKETVLWSDIEKVSDATKEVFACVCVGCGPLCPSHNRNTKTCGKNYRVIKQEIDFYTKRDIPLPRKCPDCRFYERVAHRNPRKLWHRTCQCAGIQSENGVYKNTILHFHDTSSCPTEFETPYAPERKEIVYCEKCYQSEVA